MLRNIATIAGAVWAMSMAVQALNVTCNYVDKHPGQTGLLYVAGEDAPTNVSNKNIGFDSTGAATVSPKKPATFTSFACTNDLQYIKNPSETIYGSPGARETFYKIAIGDLRSRKSLTSSDNCLTVNFGRYSGVQNLTLGYMVLYESKCRFASEDGWQETQTFVGYTNGTTKHPSYIKLLGTNYNGRSSTGNYYEYNIINLKDQIYFNQPSYGGFGDSGGNAFQGLRFGKAPTQ